MRMRMRIIEKSGEGEAKTKRSVCWRMDPGEAEIKRTIVQQKSLSEMKTMKRNYHFPRRLDPGEGS